jgi:hypothetical protein
MVCPFFPLLNLSPSRRTNVPNKHELYIMVKIQHMPDKCNNNCALVFSRCTCVMPAVFNWYSYSRYIYLSKIKHKLETKAINCSWTVVSRTARHSISANVSIANCNFLGLISGDCCCFVSL